MAQLSSRSIDNLAQAHIFLRTVMVEAIKDFDFIIICGHRGEAEQERAFGLHTTKAHFGQSPHNYTPSLAVDCCPNPVNWNDTKAFLAMGKHIIDVSKKLSIAITWGADWDGDGNLLNNHFTDMPHFELTGWRQMIKDQKATLQV
jgi:peptidoglycan L-alanyl-D-glutamate endopeptidase CwlK